MDTDINSHVDEKVMESYANIPLDGLKQYVRKIRNLFSDKKSVIFVVLEAITTD